jgi:hypothetical protein
MSRATEMLGLGPDDIFDDAMKLIRGEVTRGANGQWLTMFAADDPKYLAAVATMLQNCKKFFHAKEIVETVKSMPVSKQAQYVKLMLFLDDFEGFYDPNGKTRRVASSTWRGREFVSPDAPREISTALEVLSRIDAGTHSPTEAYAEVAELFGYKDPRQVQGYFLKWEKFLRAVVAEIGPGPPDAVT